MSIPPFAPKFIETDEMKSLVFEILDVESRSPEKPTPKSHPGNFYEAHSQWLKDSIPFREERVRLVVEWQRIATLANPEWVRHFGLTTVGYW